MNPELIIISENQLFEYLSEKERPVMEFDIIKHFMETCEQQTLYVKHFSLYHALYKLKHSAGLKGFYLHLDCMRIRLIRIPDNGLCGFYDPVNGIFCNSHAPSGFCILHENECRNYLNSITYDYLHDFYTDPDNITFGESELLRKLMNGIKVYSCRRRDIDEAIEFFGIGRFSKKSVSDRYRELAGKYHPDIPGGSDEMMKKLNSSYMILKDVFIL